MQKRFLAMPLLNFALAAALGLLMRFSQIQPIPIRYRYLTHAHSHVAMLGWVYLALFILIVWYFVPKERRQNYNRLFWITQISVLGMYVSFPFQGYGAVSIASATTHVICSYVFAWKIWKDTKGIKTTAAQFLRISLVFMLISLMGIWGVGPTAATMGTDSAGFNIAIQVFLHFQFNGWYVFSILALLFHNVNLQRSRHYVVFRNLLAVSVLLGFALPVSWYAPNDLLIGINAVGTLMQLVAAGYLIKFLKPYIKDYWRKSPEMEKLLLLFAVTGFLLKILLQCAALIESLAKTLLQYPNFVIGFIHLVMLGMISCFLFMLYLRQRKFVGHEGLLISGMIFFMVGILATEFLLLIQGLVYYLGGNMWPSYLWGLFLSSVILVAGVWLVLIQMFVRKKKVQ